MSIVDIARPDIRALEPYRSARGEAAAAGRVLLNANESPWPSPVDHGLRLNRYPDPQPAELIGALARNYGVDASRVLGTSGSDAGIDLIVRAFCRAGRDAVLHCPPTFGMFAVSAGIQGAALVSQPLRDDFSLDADALLDRVDAAGERPVRVVFLCSPNNPTGNALEPRSIARVCERLQERALVVVDEAYAEFSEGPGAIPELDRFDNLAVLRTLSKAHALAGLRLGCVLAHPDVIGLLRRIIPPYPLPAPTVAAAVAALRPEHRARTAAQVGAIRLARERLTARLAGYRFVARVWPSRANFVLAKVADGPGLARFTRERGVLIREFGHTAGLESCVRISVGAAHEMVRLIALLDEYEAARH